MMTHKEVMSRLMFAVLFCAGAASADDVTDSINEGLQQYKAGNYSEAASSLDYAATLIRQKKGGEIQALLPKALPGWTAEEGETSVAGAAMFGGGVNATRNYNKDDSYISVSITTDSPLLQGMMMMFGNPMMMSAGGQKLEKINGEKAVIEYSKEDRGGSINVVIANRFLVTVDGSDASLEDMKAYAAAIDFKKLAAIP